MSAVIAGERNPLIEIASAELAIDTIDDSIGVTSFKTSFADATAYFFPSSYYLQGLDLFKFRIHNLHPGWYYSGASYTTPYLMGQLFDSHYRQDYGETLSVRLENPKYSSITTSLAGVTPSTANVDMANNIPLEFYGQALYEKNPDASGANVPPNTFLTRIINEEKVKVERISPFEYNIEVLPNGADGDVLEEDQWFYIPDANVRGMPNTYWGQTGEESTLPPGAYAGLVKVFAQSMLDASLGDYAEGLTSDELTLLKKANNGVTLKYNSKLLRSNSAAEERLSYLTDTSTTAVIEGAVSTGTTMYSDSTDPAGYSLWTSNPNFQSYVTKKPVDPNDTSSKVIAQLYAPAFSGLEQFIQNTDSLGTGEIEGNNGQDWLQTLSSYQVYSNLVQSEKAWYKCGWITGVCTVGSGLFVRDQNKVALIPYSVGRSGGIRYIQKHKPPVGVENTSITLGQFLDCGDFPKQVALVAQSLATVDPETLLPLCATDLQFDSMADEVIGSYEVPSQASLCYPQATASIDATPLYIPNFGDSYCYVPSLVTKGPATQFFMLKPTANLEDLVNISLSTNSDWELSYNFKRRSLNSQKKIKAGVYEVAAKAVKSSYPTDAEIQKMIKSAEYESGYVDDFSTKTANLIGRSPQCVYSDLSNPTQGYFQEYYGFDITEARINLTAQVSDSIKLVDVGQITSTSNPHYDTGNTWKWKFSAVGMTPATYPCYYIVGEATWKKSSPYPVIGSPNSATSNGIYSGISGIVMVFAGFIPKGTPKGVYKYKPISTYQISSSYLTVEEDSGTSEISASYVSYNRLIIVSSITGSSTIPYLGSNFITVRGVKVNWDAAIDVMSGSYIEDPVLPQYAKTKKKLLLVGADDDKAEKNIKSTVVESSYRYYQVLKEAEMISDLHSYDSNHLLVSINTDKVPLVGYPLTRRPVLMQIDDNTGLHLNDVADLIMSNPFRDTTLDLTMTDPEDETKTVPIHEGWVVVAASVLTNKMYRILVEMDETKSYVVGFKHVYDSKPLFQTPYGAFVQLFGLCHTRDIHYEADSKVAGSSQDQVVDDHLVLYGLTDATVSCKERATNLIVATCRTYLEWDSDKDTIVRIPIKDRYTKALKIQHFNDFVRQENVPPAEAKEAEAYPTDILLFITAKGKKNQIRIQRVTGIDGEEKWYLSYLDSTDGTFFDLSVSHFDPSVEHGLLRLIPSYNMEDSKEGSKEDDSAWDSFVSDVKVQRAGFAWKSRPRNLAGFTLPVDEATSTAAQKIDSNVTSLDKTKFYYQMMSLDPLDFVINPDVSWPHGVGVLFPYIYVLGYSQFVVPNKLIGREDNPKAKIYVQDSTDDNIDHLWAMCMWKIDITAGLCSDPIMLCDVNDYIFTYGIPASCSDSYKIYRDEHDAIGSIQSKYVTTKAEKGKVTLDNNDGKYKWNDGSGDDYKVTTPRSVSMPVQHRDVIEYPAIAGLCGIDGQLFAFSNYREQPVLINPLTGWVETTGLSIFPFTYPFNSNVTSSYKNTICSVGKFGGYNVYTTQPFYQLCIADGTGPNFFGMGIDVHDITTGSTLVRKCYVRNNQLRDRLENLVLSVPDEETLEGSSMLWLSLTGHDEDKAKSITFTEALHSGDKKPFYLHVIPTEDYADDNLVLYLNAKFSRVTEYFGYRTNILE